MNKAQIVRHGEVILKPDTLPKNAKLVEQTKKYIVAHSETGHHHVLESIDKYEVFTSNGDTYIKLGTVGTLFHEKSGTEVHTPHTIVPSVYKVVIKKSFDYFTGKLARVRD
jgi:hypothetical protein